MTPAGTAAVGASAGAARDFTFMTPGSALAPSPQPSPPMFATGAAAPIGRENQGAADNGACIGRAEGAVRHQPIAALNPYKSKWTILAKVDSKRPLKHSAVRGEAIAILTVVLVDEAVRCPSPYTPFASSKTRRHQAGMLPPKRA
jgi:hypothetical protein